MYTVKRAVKLPPHCRIRDLGVGDVTTEKLAEFPTALVDSVRGAEHKAAAAYEGKPGQRCNHRTHLQLHKANKKLQKEEFCDQSRE